MRKSTKFERKVCEISTGAASHERKWCKKKYEYGTKSVRARQVTNESGAKKKKLRLWYEIDTGATRHVQKSGPKIYEKSTKPQIPEQKNKLHQHDTRRYEKRTKSRKTNSTAAGPTTPQPELSRSGTNNDWGMELNRSVDLASYPFVQAREDLIGSKHEWMWYRRWITIYRYI